MDRREVHLIVPTQMSTGIYTVPALPGAFLSNSTHDRVIDMVTDYVCATDTSFPAY